MAERFGHTTGPAWVWLAFNSSCARSRPYSLAARAATSSARLRGMPIRSRLTKTNRRPPASSSASARTYSGWSTPSDGWSRTA